MASMPDLLRRRKPNLYTTGSCRGSERQPDGRKEFLVVKRFGEKSQGSGVQRSGTNQWIIISGEDDNACGRRNFPELRLDLQPAHLRHANINQRNLRAMSTGIIKKRLGIAKCFHMLIG